MAPYFDISIIIPVYNNLEYTKKCLYSIFRVEEQLIYEVILVDDASTDATSAVTKNLFKNIHVIRNDKNSGFAKSCNAGAHAARGSYLVFLNNDTIALPGWLTGMYRCMRNDSGIGLVGNLQIYPDTGLVQHAGKVCGENFKIYSIYNRQLKGDHPAVNKPREFQFVTGSCIMIEREFFLSLGGFDEAYLNSCEDVDLCMKVRQAGRRVYYCPESRILHYESKSVKGHSRNDGNYARFLERWHENLIRDDIAYLTEDGMIPNPAKNSCRANNEKIAILSTFNQPCGIATHTHYLCTGLRNALSNLENSTVDIIILAESEAGNFKCDPSNVFRCWHRKSEDFAKVFDVVKREKATILHIQFQVALFINTGIIQLAQQCRSRGIKVFATFHSSENSLGFCAKLINSIDMAFVHLEQSAIRFIAFGADPKKIKMVPHGILADRKVPAIGFAKTALRIPEETALISSFGFLEPHKGVEGILSALPHVFKTHPNSLFAFLGGCNQNNASSANYFKKCIALSQRLGIHHQVMFADGYVSETMASQYLAASDVIVLNYTLNINEISGAASFALAHGRPLITSATPAFKALTSCTLQLSMEMDIGKAISLILERPELAAYLIAKSRTFIENNSYEVLALILLKAYGILKDDSGNKITHFVFSPHAGYDTGQSFIGSAAGGLSAACDRH